jgi:hypothetical protein
MNEVAADAQKDAGAVRADETMIDNPAYEGWAKFKPGTTVKDTTSVTGGTTQECTTTLKDINADKATIEFKISSVISGEQFNHTTVSEIPSKIDKMDPAYKLNSDEKVVDAGIEDVQAAGKTYSCKKTIEVASVTSNAGVSTVKMTTWESDDVPGRKVKEETEVDGSVSETEILTDAEPNQ